MSDFYDNHEEALRQPKIVLRDSLGVLAIEILKSREDISKLSYEETMQKLLDIIKELQRV